MPPSQLFPSAMPWRGINTENSVIRGSNLKGHQSHFWIGVNLSGTFKCYMKQGKRSFCVTMMGKRWDPTNYFLYNVFHQGWYEFQLKYRRLCFGFCKIKVPDSVSRDLWCQNWHISWCSHWKFRQKKFL